MSNVPMRMFPRPKTAERLDGELFFGKKMYLHIGKQFVNTDQIKLFRELYTNFTSGLSKLTIVQQDTKFQGAVFSANASESLDILDDRGEMDYCLYVDSKKAVMLFHDNASFAHALCTLLSQIEARNEKERIFTLPICRIRDLLL